MSLRAIVSYDDTQNDHDALMLGLVLRDAGAKLTLAYVRHATQSQPFAGLVADAAAAARI